MTVKTSRIESLFSQKKSDEKVMSLFISAGYPDLDSTVDLILGFEKNGADLIELGMPFSDPLAEGLPIQRASERALRHGVRMRDTLATAEAFRAESQTPLLLMGYLNPIHRYGIRNFCRDARSSGVDGLILPDLPPEESELLTEAAREAELDLVFLIAPNTTDDRIRTVDQKATGFVYAVSITGLTGTGLGEVDRVEQYLKRANRIVKRNPLLVGFGIRTPDDARRLSQHTDGFIVGSALITLVERLWDEGDAPRDERLSEVRAFVQHLHEGTAEASGTVSARG